MCSWRRSGTEHDGHVSSDESEGAKTVVGPVHGVDEQRWEEEADARCVKPRLARMVVVGDGGGGAAERERERDSEMRMRRWGAMASREGREIERGKEKWRQNN